MKKHPWQTSYKVTNWSDYNRALINRGSLTIWFSAEVLKVWMEVAQTGGKGHPYTYSDAAIECMLILKGVFRLALRQTQGIMSSLMNLIASTSLHHTMSKDSRDNSNFASCLQEGRYSFGSGCHRA